MGKIDLTGQCFGKLTVIEEAERDKRGNATWRCRCECGDEVTVRGSHLRSGHTQSCGCFHLERRSECFTTHGLSRSRLYRVWYGILVRTGIHKCSNEEVKRYYQDRGITVCPEWESFVNFMDWALSNGYSDNLEIDRINNDKGYMPENCRFVSRKENDNNRRNTIRLEDGTSLAMFCSEVGIQMRENGRVSKQYNRIKDAYRKYHKAHPELLAKANETILLYRKCVELRKLRDEVKQLLEQVKAMKGERP